jgi:hypothetical protein
LDAELEHSGRSWLGGSAPFFKLPLLPQRDTRRDTRRFQGGPGHGGRPGTFWFLSWCPSEGVAGAWKRGRSHLTSFFQRAPGKWNVDKWLQNGSNQYGACPRHLWWFNRPKGPAPFLGAEIKCWKNGYRMVLTIMGHAQDICNGLTGPRFQRLFGPGNQKLKKWLQNGSNHYGACPKHL